MKTISVLWKQALLVLLTVCLSCAAVFAQNSNDKRLINDAKKAKSAFSRHDKLMNDMFNNSYGYAIFPNVGKGAAGVGAAAGSGIVYEKGHITGSVKMTQLTVGLQLGGQAFREVIFFEDKAALDRFKNDALEFTAQTSAVAMTASNSMNAKYRDGVMVFTKGKSGLMYDASLGGQKFDYDSF